MAMNPQLLMLLLQQAPKLMNALRARGDSLDDISQMLELNGVDTLANRGYDLNLLNTDDFGRKESHNIFNDAYDYSVYEEFPSDTFGYAGRDGITNPAKQSHDLNMLSTDELNDLYNKEQMRGHSAKVSALAMLQNNPLIGTPQDPQMLPFRDPMEGISPDTYTPAQQNLFEKAPFTGDSLVSDDDPDDELSKLAKLLLTRR